jgi:hypothetical protein
VGFAFESSQFVSLIHVAFAEFPFLQGRAFVFASSFVLILSEKGISAQYLEAAVQALESDAVEAVVKISAVKCIRK